MGHGWIGVFAEHEKDERKLVKHGLLCCWETILWRLCIEAGVMEGGVGASPHGKWQTAAVDWPDGEPGRPGADG